ncbi:MAG: ABC transporter permease [Nitrospirae bacterium]|nr:ABC transporter permease [Nitrospirota bacterium]
MFVARAALALLWREQLQFFRQRSRVVGALLTPVVFWLLLGAGLRSSFKPQGVPAGVDFLEYFFPGTVVMIMLFASIFSTISVIEDRKTGFLQGVLVAPVPRGVIVIGKVLGGTLVATLQAGLFLLLGMAFGMSAGVVGFLAAIGVLLLVGAGLTSLGFILAWRLDSTQGFHAVMNLFLLPMWFLSGSFFPGSGGAGWLRAIMMVNPLTYGVAAFRRAVYWSDPLRAGDVPSWGACLAALGIFLALTFTVAKIMCDRRTNGDH